ncbi:MAG: hypothetical protein KY428_03140 [Bacteroidetes bacterium]|nr:hypothetical protein [Bacteroidota bacterium]
MQNNIRYLYIATTGKELAATGSLGMRAQAAVILVSGVIYQCPAMTGDSTNHTKIGPRSYAG